MKKQSNYSEQVKSPLWQKKRLEVLNLRGFKCEICGNEKDQLHVHHRFYIKGRKIHEYDNDVLQVLCEKCHESEHEISKRANIITQFISINEDCKENINIDLADSIVKIFANGELLKLTDFIETLNELIENRNTIDRLNSELNKK
jgi:Zn finger protein HypA/HybF involved in hydrogenase expression